MEAAERLDDPALLVRALVEEGDAIRMQGDLAAALVRSTRVLAIAEDPASRGRLDAPQAVRAVASASMLWVDCARDVGGIAVRELFGVLDAGDASFAR